MGRPNRIPLTDDDVVAIQFYLDLARRRIAEIPVEQKASAIVMVEEPFHAPEIHELCYGTLDLAIVAGKYCELTDYKHGEGIYVAAENNWQLMQYAAMVLQRFPFIERFLLRICQPRLEGAAQIREWEISTKDLREWIDWTLVPAMNAAASEMQVPSHYEPVLRPGEWCRFCKAGKALACPAVQHDALVVQDTAPIVEKVSAERLGDLYAKVAPLKMMCKAIEEEVLRRRLNGIDVPGTKTVQKKTFRVWKDGAEEALRAALGDCVMSKPALQGPAVVEKLSKLAKQLTVEYAFSPDAGYTVAPLDDPRKAIEVQKPSEAFAKVVDRLPTK